MPDSVTVLERNLLTWVHTAPLRDLLLVLDIIGHELLVQRGAGPVEQAGVDALSAANHLRPLAAKSTFEILDVADALQVLGRNQGERGGS